MYLPLKFAIVALFCAPCPVQGQELRGAAAVEESHNVADLYKYQVRRLSSGSETSDSHAAEDEHDEGAHAGHHESGAFKPTLFFLITYATSAAAQTLVKGLPKWLRPPHSVVLYVLGMLLAAVAHNAVKLDGSEYTRTMSDFMGVDPHVIFWVFLPALLYEDAAGSQWHVIHRVLPSALLMAFPGVMLNTVLTAFLVRYCCSGFEFEPALLLGSILSATDPVAVVGALNVLQAPAKLSSLISGESLFNDGSAVAMFQIFKEVVANQREFDIFYSIAKMCRLALGGVFFGLVVSSLVFCWISRTRNFKVEMLVIVVAIYGCFFVAEHEVVGASGVLAVVTFGFFMCSVGHFSIDVEREHEHHTIIGFLALISNEAIFLIAGLVGYNFTFVHEGSYLIGARDWLDLGILYVGIHVTRTLVILVCWPLLSNWGYGLDMKEAVICVFGGLRGAVGLAMALLVVGESAIEDATRAKIAFHCSGIVVLTLLVNGTTITTIYNKLGIVSPKQKKHHDKLVADALQHLDQITKKQAKLYQDHWFFRNCNADLVMKLVPSFSAHFESHFKDELGQRQMKHAEGRSSPVETVNQVCEQIADYIKVNKLATPEEMKARCFQRVGYSRKDSMASWNLFLSDGEEALNSERVKDVEEEEVTLAMNELRMEVGTGSLHVDDLVRESNKKLLLSRSLKVFVNLHAEAKLKAPSQDPQGAVREGNTKDALDLERIKLEDAEKRTQAKKRWKRALALAVTVVKKVKVAKEQASQNRANFFDRFSAYRTSSNMEAQSLAEIMQIAINSMRAEYNSAFESRALSQVPYEILMSGLGHAEDALHGDLDPTSIDVKRAGLLEVAEQPEEQQMQEALSVSFKHMKSYFGRPRNLSMKIIGSLVGFNSLVYSWLVLRRDVEMLLAFIFTQAHISEELADLHIFRAKLLVEAEMRVEEAKRLFISIGERSPTLMVVFEHLLFAKLLMRVQSQILKKMEEEGSLTGRDTHHLHQQVLRKYEKAVNHFTPTLELLQKAAAKEKYPLHRKLDDLISLIWFGVLAGGD